MPADTIFCDNGHLFCKDCVRKGCEVKIGEGKLNFPCLEDCDQQFSLQILKVRILVIFIVVIFYSVYSFLFFY